MTRKYISLCMNAKSKHLSHKLCNACDLGWNNIKQNAQFHVSAQNVSENKNLYHIFCDQMQFLIFIYVAEKDLIFFAMSVSLHHITCCIL
mmetsp:Transcript_28910/g.36263  ORF Transcript_28910/g.36263 Transcript_28910/m.36263 type:complete len:90 (+) Transcript_28910:639-908(+)